MLWYKSSGTYLTTNDLLTISNRSWSFQVHSLIYRYFIQVLRIFFHSFVISIFANIRHTSNVCNQFLFHFNSSLIRYFHISIGFWFILHVSHIKVNIQSLKISIFQKWLLLAKNYCVNWTHHPIRSDNQKLICRSLL